MKLSNSPFLKPNLPLKILFILGVLGYFVLFFPGLMSFDSQSYYQNSLSSVYYEHSPCFMVWVWNKLNHIYPSTAWMFCINMALLWGSVYLFSFRILKARWIQYLTILMPYTIWVAIYAGWIWKDTLLAFGYAFLCAVFIDKMQRKHHFSWGGIAAILLLLTYYSEAKWAQARFVCPLFLLWLMEIQQPYWTRFKRWMVAALLSACFIFSVHSLRAKVLEQMPSSHFWQYVNIYDLAGTSIYANTYLVPDFLVIRPGLDLLKQKYDLLWEPLIAYPDSPLRKTQSDAERTALTQAWIKAVISHPIAYIQHRSRVFFRGLFICSPLNRTSTWIAQYQKYPFLYYIGVVSTYDWLLPAQLWLAFRSRHRSVRKMNQIGLSFLAVLFIFSLAGTPRYIFVSMVLCIFSIAYAIDMRLRTKNQPN